MKTVVLTGGVGGAKLVAGLARCVPAADLTVVVNTGDDFEHLGLQISPDIDTLFYTLSGRASSARGWGREDESWNFMEALGELGGETWFQLGDRDLALHVMRTLRLHSGFPLSSVTRDLARRFGIDADILPMTNDPVETMIDTDAGRLAFQKYFVAARCEPIARQIIFSGAERASPAPGVCEAIASAQAILFAPSNPYLSIDPILAIPDLRRAIATAPGARVAVSPLVGGQAVKGPTVKLMQELGFAVNNRSIADHYHGLIDGLLVHEGDDVPLGLDVAACDTLMASDDDRLRVAEAALGLADRIGPHRGKP